MMIEFARGRFGEKLVAASCAGLDFDTTGKGQFYAGPYKGLA